MASIPENPPWIQKEELWPTFLLDQGLWVKCLQHTFSYKNFQLNRRSVPKTISYKYLQLHNRFIVVSNSDKKSWKTSYLYKVKVQSCACMLPRPTDLCRWTFAFIHFKYYPYFCQAPALAGLSYIITVPNRPATRRFSPTIPPNYEGQTQEF